MCRLSCNEANRYCRLSTVNAHTFDYYYHALFFFVVFMCSQQLNTWENKFLIRYNGDFDSIADLHCTKESPTKSHSSSFTYAYGILLSVYSNFLKELMHLSTSCFSFWKVDLTFTRHIFNETNVKKLLKTGIISIWSTDTRS